MTTTFDSCQGGGERVSERTPYVLRGQFIECGCPDAPIRIHGDNYRKARGSLVCSECGVDVGAALDVLRKSVDDLGPEWVEPVVCPLCTGPALPSISFSELCEKHRSDWSGRHDQA